MESANRAKYLIFLVVITLIPDVQAYQYCSRYRSCRDGYHCCSGNSRCCKNTGEGGWIAGVVIGACVVVGGVIFLVIFCYCKKKNARTQVGFNTAPQPGQPPVYGQQMYGQPMYVQSMNGQPSYGQQSIGFQQPVSDEKLGTSNAAYPPPPANYS